MRRIEDVWNQVQSQVNHCPRWALHLAAALVLFGTGFGFGYYRGAHVYGQPVGNGEAQQQLDAAQKAQRGITDTAERATQRASDVQDRITRSQEAVERANERVESAAGSLAETGSLIDDCQRILEEVWSRGKTDPAAH